MKVHHLNCGTMTTPTAPMVCHVLLVETDGGLVLVDSGFGSDDCRDPAGRIGPTRHLIRPRLDHRETAVHHVERLGFQRNDVRHIVITHFDVDHIGGLSDFPEARIHVTAAERSAPSDLRRGGRDCAARPHPRPCVRRGRRRPPVDAALR